jgi:hypothetical protein
MTNLIWRIMVAILAAMQRGGHLPAEKALSAVAHSGRRPTSAVAAPGQAVSTEWLSREWAEELVLAELMTNPVQERNVVTWLPADSFSGPAAAQLYELESERCPR